MHPACMQCAIALAEEAIQTGQDRPFGTVIVRNDTLIAKVAAAP